MNTEIVDLEDSSDAPSPEEQNESLSFTYPPNSTGSIKLTEFDLDTLEVGQMVNDNIINFYLMYLIVERGLTGAVYVFNSFFYPKLVGLQSHCLHYTEVQSWTRNVDLFAKECLIVPIIQNAHWRLAVVAHPSELFQHTDDSKRPYIICFDSYSQGYDPTVTWNIHEYLKLEWKTKQGDSETIDDPIQNLMVTHPMQNNESDCGLFVLEFAERYLMEREEFHEAARDGETVNKSNWFECVQAEKKRFHLIWLIRTLADGLSAEEKTVLIVLPANLLSNTRRRKRPRRPLEDEFSYYT